MDVPVANARTRANMCGKSAGQSVKTELNKAGVQTYFIQKIK